jgi:hypothetical protein
VYLAIHRHLGDVDELLRQWLILVVAVVGIAFFEEQEVLQGDAKKRHAHLTPQVTNEER